MVRASTAAASGALAALVVGTGAASLVSPPVLPFILFFTLTALAIVAIRVVESTHTSYLEWVKGRF